MTRTLTRLIVTRPFLMKVLFWATITMLALLAASCGDNGGGMWQGGGDSEPSWR